MDEPLHSNNNGNDSDIDEPELPDVSEYYQNHPSGVNKAYEWPKDYVSDGEADDSEYNFNDYIAIPNLPYDENESPFIPPSQRDDAPLASILNPQLDCVDPRRCFPDYAPDKVLRFSRIFASNIKPSLRPDIWWATRPFNKKASKEEKSAFGSGPEQKKLKLVLGTPPNAEDLQVDQEVLLLRPGTSKCETHDVGDDDEADNRVAAWRNGPAKIWYDRMNVGSSVSNFDYGFKLKQETPAAPTGANSLEENNNIKSENVETFLPVNLIRWEDDIIYDGEDVRQQICDEIRSGKQPACGWIPTQNTRTYEAYLQHVKNKTFEQLFQRRSTPSPLVVMPLQEKEFQTEPTTTHSILPLENHELLNTRWEDDIIWDDQQMKKIPEPKVLTLDYYDDPLIFGLPDDRRPDEIDPATNKPFDRKDHQFTKKSKMILGQVQQRQKQEEEEQMETSMAQMTDKDAFNLSNDDYYMPKNVNRSGSAGNNMLIQHSIPSQNIHRVFFPTNLNTFQLRHWHRQPLAKRVFRIFGYNRYINIESLTKHIREMDAERQRRKIAEGGGDIFFMREVEDLSGRDGDLVLLEYSEEHPPLLNQPGMASKIKNYYKRRAGKDVEPEFDYGDLAFSHNVPFLGQLQPGQAIQSIENNLFRAPLYRHDNNPNDFLLIRYRQGWYIRRCPPLFLVGQECPLSEVPSPNSKRATTFVRDFLLAYIYRLFWANDQTPRRLKMEDIKAAFPQYAESSVRKRLKVCADFKRLGTGPDQNYWVLRPEFRLPSKEEVLSMVTPEMCCAQNSMLAAEQRLKDAGYGERYFFTPENEEDSDDQVTMEEEIKCAPWNTTRAFISAARGKCLLDPQGIADPTGCGQGFSYVRISQKPVKVKDDTPTVPKRLVTGTNADLRKLPLKEAKEICRGYGVREDEINALTRWEIIDVIRTLSTEAAKAKNESGETSSMSRFARGNIRFNFADMQEKHKKHCQHLFDLQNQTLGNPELLSTDEGPSGDDSDNEEWSTRLESMLQNKGKKNPSVMDRARMEFENEERERQDLKRMIHGETKPPTAAPVEAKKEMTAEEKKTMSKIGEEISQSASKILGITTNQKLKIYRSIRNADGTLSTRVEVVTRPQLIEAYTRIRTSKDETFIQVYAQMDEEYKEERRKEKRRLQDQLRRIKKNEERVKSGKPGAPKTEKKQTPIKPHMMKVKCSACGGFGHMKTNKHCPLFGQGSVSTPTKDNTDDDMTQMSEVSVIEGCKLKINRKLIEGHDPNRKKTQKRSLMMSDSSANNSFSKVDVDDDSDAEPSFSRSARLPAGGGNVKRRQSSMFEDDYLHGPAKRNERARADPKVSMSIILSEIVTELKTVNGIEPLLIPVSKKVYGYYDRIKEPMDLQKIKAKVESNQYELRQDFLRDVKKMLDNSREFNTDNHVITEVARKVFELAGKRVLEKEHQFVKLEKQINPLLDENDRIGFGFILADIVQRCRNIPKSAAFHNKVDAKKTPGYFDVVKKEMHFSLMDQKIKNQEYATVQHFKDDIDQIVQNSSDFNGATNYYTLKAHEISDLANKLLADKAEQLAELEANINGGAPVEEVEDYVEDNDNIEDEEMIDVADGGILNDDLALSGDEMEEDEEEEWTTGGDMPTTSADLMQSRMNIDGQLNTDLNLSSSDEEEKLDEYKRAGADDNNFDAF